MAEARAYRQRRKVYDPMRALWESLVARSEADSDLRSWQDHEKIYFAVSLLEGEVYNGGFDQYFHNSASNYYPLAVRGLKTVGALQSLQIVQAAADVLFGLDRPPTDQALRWPVLNSRTQNVSEIVSRHLITARLEHLDQQFCRDPDHLPDRLTAFANATGLVAPFELDPG